MKYRGMELSLRLESPRQLFAGGSGCCDVLGEWQTQAEKHFPLRFYVEGHEGASSAERELSKGPAQLS